MKCFACEHTLIKTGRLERYQTLIEHIEDVGDTEEVPPRRQVFVCPNEKCEVHTTKSFFDGYGCFHPSVEFKKTETFKNRSINIGVFDAH
jgi:hypothetical protein